MGLALCLLLIQRMNVSQIAQCTGDSSVISRPRGASQCQCRASIIIQLFPSVLSTSRRWCPSIYHAILFLPFTLLLVKIFLPVFALILAKNPDRLFCSSLVCPFMVLRGPHRTCRSHSAGCAVMAVLGTISAPDAEGAGVKLVRLGRMAIVLDERVGRRGVNVVNVLWR